MCDVRADKFRGLQPVRIQVDECHGSEGARAYGSQSYKTTDDDSRNDSETRLELFEADSVFGAEAFSNRVKMFPDRKAGCRDDQCDAKGLKNHPAAKLVLTGDGQEPYSESCGRQAPVTKASDNFPVDGSFLTVNVGAKYFCDACEQQICADCRLRSDSEKKDQDGSHERTAADAGNTDDQSDGKSRKNCWDVDHRFQCRRESSIRRMSCTHSSTLRVAVSMASSGLSGISYGALTPVNSAI